MQSNASYSYGVANEFIRDDTGRITHIKIFLYDTTFSKNGSRLTENAADMSMNSFKGLDFIVTPDLSHNVFIDDMTASMPDGGVFALTRPLSDYIAAGAKFSVGKLIEIQKKQIATANGSTMPAYYGLVKLTSDYFIDKLTALANQYQDIREAKLYVSSFFAGMPAITALASQEQNTKVVYDGPVQGIHVALVKNPAYNESRSLISGSCSGNDATCGSMLLTANASQSLTNFNDSLLDVAKTLYSAANSVNNNKGMSEENNKPAEEKPAEDQPSETKAATKTVDNKTQNTKTIQVTQEQYDEITKQVKELSAKLEKKAEKESKQETDELNQLRTEMAELKREKAINNYLDKIKALPGMDAKVALKYATIIIDKKFTTEEAEDFIKSLVPMLKASANQATPCNKERKLDSALKFNLASASSYADLNDDEKQTINRTVNLAAIQMLNLLKR